jgi:hypothetical protein
MIYAMQYACPGSSPGFKYRLSVADDLIVHSGFLPGLSASEASYFYEQADGVFIPFVSTAFQNGEFITVFVSAFERNAFYVLQKTNAP